MISFSKKYLSRIFKDVFVKMVSVSDRASYTGAPFVTAILIITNNFLNVSSSNYLISYEIYKIYLFPEKSVGHNIIGRVIQKIFKVIIWIISIKLVFISEFLFNSFVLLLFDYMIFSGIVIIYVCITLQVQKSHNIVYSEWE